MHAHFSFTIPGLPIFVDQNSAYLTSISRNDVNSNVTKTMSRKRHIVTPPTPTPTHTTTSVIFKLHIYNALTNRWFLCGNVFFKQLKIETCFTQMRIKCKE